MHSSLTEKIHSESSCNVEAAQKEVWVWVLDLWCVRAGVSCSKKKKNASCHPVSILKTQFGSFSSSHEGDRRSQCWWKCFRSICTLNLWPNQCLGKSLVSFNWTKEGEVRTKVEETWFVRMKAKFKRSSAVPYDDQRCQELPEFGGGHGCSL